MQPIETFNEGERVRCQYGGFGDGSERTYEYVIGDGVRRGDFIKTHRVLSRHVRENGGAVFDITHDPAIEGFTHRLTPVVPV